MTPTFRFPENKEFVLTAIGASDGHMNEFLSSADFIGRPAWMPDGKSMVVPMQCTGVQEMQTKCHAAVERHISRGRCRADHE
jgi:hypothetical protein